MSDGNYNRNLLPYHNYQSGVRAGRATMLTKSVKAFEEILRNELKIDDDRVEALLNKFRTQLESNH